MIECDCQAPVIAAFLAGIVTTICFILWYGNKPK